VKQEKFISGLDIMEVNLCNAVFCSNYKKVEVLLANGADPNMFVDGVSLLYIALNKSFVKNKFNIIRKLLDNGANPKQLFLCNTSRFNTGEPFALPSIIELICTLPDVTEYEAEYSELVQLLLTKFQCKIGWAYDYALNKKLMTIAKIILLYSDEIKIFSPKDLTKDEVIEAIIAAHQ